MVIISNNLTPNNYTEPSQFNFDLSDWQKWAIWSIQSNYNTLVCAPTGSGKTLPAEYAIKFFNDIGKKVIYTSPIKALSNQKYHDFKQLFPEYEFGLLTGDIKENCEASNIIMTTEILKNNLNHTSTNGLNFNIDIENEVGIIIYDEAHYFNDTSRGHIWEQCFILQPNNIPMLLMSATIANPNIFAEWLSTISNKETVLAMTNVRQVPLYHYSFSTYLESSLKRMKDTSAIDFIKQHSNKLIELKDKTFSDQAYNTISKLKQYMYAHNIRPTKKQVINKIVNYLIKNNLTPAICFIFSRKEVERFASMIQFNLHKDHKKIEQVNQECKKIIMKLPNYKEYLLLQEYNDLIHLIERGIGIHHSGMIPIFREIVELMFDKGYIELLFATETFAVGLNMPTKTVLFTSLEKYSENGFRYLYSHEYTQQAGRAGRRGYDNKGVVIHLTNLYDFPPAQDLKNIMSNKAQSLKSQFKFSYNLFLENINVSLDRITEDTMINDDIKKEVKYYTDENNNTIHKLLELEEQLQTINTPMDILKSYHNFYELDDKNCIKSYELEYTSIKEDYILFKTSLTYKSDIEYNNYYKMNSEKYIEWHKKIIFDILKSREFIDDADQLTKKGKCAIYFHEIDSIAISTLLEETNYLKKFTPNDIVALLSIFTDIKVSEENRIYTLDNNVNLELKYAIQFVETVQDKMQTLEHNFEVYINNDNLVHYDMIELIINWCKVQNEHQCCEFISTLPCFIGDFIKACLKIVKILEEFKLMCEDLEEYELLTKIDKCYPLILKFVITNQSLYVG